MFEAAFGPVVTLIAVMPVIWVLSRIWSDEYQLSRVARKLGVAQAVIVLLANRDEAWKLLEMTQAKATTRYDSLFCGVRNLMDELQTRASLDDDKDKFWDDLYIRMDGLREVAAGLDSCIELSEILTKVSADALNPDTSEEYIELEIETDNLLYAFEKLGCLAIKIKVSEPKAA